MTHTITLTNIAGFRVDAYFKEDAETDELRGTKSGIRPEPCHRLWQPKEGERWHLVSNPKEKLVYYRKEPAQHFLLHRVF